MSIEKNILNYFKQIKKKGPNFNNFTFFLEKYFIEYLNILLNQTYEDFEIICIIYNNKDSSNNILNKYAEINKRLIIFNKNIKRIEETRIFGIEKAKGEYLLFLDINNSFDYNFIEEIINEIDKTLHILIFSYELYNETSEIFYTDNYSYETI